MSSSSSYTVNGNDPAIDSSSAVLLLDYPSNDEKKLNEVVIIIFFLDIDFIKLQQAKIELWPDDVKITPFFFKFKSFSIFLFD